MNEEEIKAKAIDFAKQNKIQIAEKLTNPDEYIPDDVPISVFMAGSPGAGKTEFSKHLIEVLEKDMEHRVIRIDGDEIRPLISGYTGGNSHLFQGAISLVVEKMQDLVLNQKQSFILDGTLANYDKAKNNIKRSLGKNRLVFIFYICQKPETAWKFTQAREIIEKRNIPKQAFIEQFFSAKETVNKILREFDDKVTVFFVKKDFEKNTVENIVKIDAKNRVIDDYIAESYTKEDLEKHL